MMMIPESKTKINYSETARSVRIQKVQDADAALDVMSEELKVGRGLVQNNNLRLSRYLISDRACCCKTVREFGALRTESSRKVTGMNGGSNLLTL